MPKSFVWGISFVPAKVIEFQAVVYFCSNNNCINNIVTGLSSFFLPTTRINVYFATI